MKKWEYKVIGLNQIIHADDDKILEKELNSLGEKGWELVGIVDQINSPWGSATKVVANHILLKREKE